MDHIHVWYPQAALLGGHGRPLSDSVSIEAIIRMLNCETVAITQKLSFPFRVSEL